MPEGLSNKVVEFLKSTCIFCQPWWLEAVAPGCWDISVVKRGQEVAAVMPYTYKVRLGRYRLLEMPTLTPYLGPWLRNSEAKYAVRLGEEKDLMTEIVKALPPFAVFHQGFHPSVKNWLPFYWNGFKQSTRYTYVIDPSKPTEEWWKETRDNIKTDIRKAKEKVQVVESDDVHQLYKLCEATFHRQAKYPPFSEELLGRIDGACMKEGARKILFAVDEQGRTHAGIYIVWDHTTVYYLLSGGDPELRNSGATSLLVWTAIEFALSQNKQFDFEGSMVESIERFVRAFGARQVPYLEVCKTNSLVVSSYRSLWKLFH